MITKLAPGSAHDGADKAFRHCLAQFATGVTIVTSAPEGEPHGMTVNSFSSVSLEPPLILWSIRRDSAFLPRIKAAGRFAVNVLSNRQQALAQAFASRDSDKFTRVSWRRAPSGSPMLEGIVAWFDCRIEALYDGGDHLIVLGYVEAFDKLGGSPLLFAGGRFESLPKSRGEAPHSSDAGFGAMGWDMPLSAAFGE